MLGLIKKSQLTMFNICKSILLIMLNLLPNLQAVDHHFLQVLLLTHGEIGHPDMLLNSVELFHRCRLFQATQQLLQR